MKEPKLKTVYVCSNCGETSPRWMGRCPSCGSWNTMNEDVVAEAPKAGLSGGKASVPARQEGVTSLTARRLADISTTEEKSRILTGISELDRVLGGPAQRRAGCWQIHHAAAALRSHLQPAQRPVYHR